MEMQQVLCFCCHSPDVFYNLFDALHPPDEISFPGRVELETILQEILSLNDIAVDQLPLVCSNCHSEFYRFYSFIFQCLESRTILSQLNGSDKFNYGMVPTNFNVKVKQASEALAELSDIRVKIKEEPRKDEETISKIQDYRTCSEYVQLQVSLEESERVFRDVSSFGEMVYQNKIETHNPNTTYSEAIKKVPMFAIKCEEPLELIDEDPEALPIKLSYDKPHSHQSGDINYKLNWEKCHTFPSKSITSKRSKNRKKPDYCNNSFNKKPDCNGSSELKQNTRRKSRNIPPSLKEDFNDIYSKKYAEKCNLHKTRRKDNQKCKRKSRMEIQLTSKSKDASSAERLKFYCYRCDINCHTLSGLNRHKRRHLKCENALWGSIDDKGTCQKANSATELKVLQEHEIEEFENTYEQPEHDHCYSKLGIEQENYILTKECRRNYSDSDESETHC